ncbi:MAG TPA: hemerythrin domain-containing protein [Vicinamibacterales bacterium]|jgi:hemerythrin-like domain-containing protein
MLLKIGQRPDHGFDEPLGLLSDCHRRIEHFLRVLEVTTDRVNGAALSAAERSQVEGAMTYFATAAPRHTADEEESLFPRMEASRDANAISVVDAIRRLESDHEEANGHHGAVDRLVRQWLADGVLPAVLVQELKQHLAALATLYAAHISFEDREIFPTAARLLSAADIQAIGREMAARRLVRR